MFGHFPILRRHSLTGNNETVLSELEAQNIFDVDLGAAENEGKILFTECCDHYHYHWLTPAQVRQLAKELEQVADDAERGP